jgi:hypothetical protein
MINHGYAHPTCFPDDQLDMVALGEYGIFWTNSRDVYAAIREHECVIKEKEAIGEFWEFDFRALGNFWRMWYKIIHNTSPPR